MSGSSAPALMIRDEYDELSCLHLSPSFGIVIHVQNSETERTDPGINDRCRGNPTHCSNLSVGVD